MPVTFPDGYDTERDSIALESTPVNAGMYPPTTPWRVIESASNQISAGQPVTALPRQSWSIAEGQAFAERLNAFDRQAKAARVAAEQAAIDARMLDQMSRVAKSTKDIEIARRSIMVSQAMRRIAAGEAPAKVLLESPGMFESGAGYGAAVEAARTPTQFTPTEVTLPSGAKGVRTGRYGEQFHYEPRPPAPDIKPGALTEAEDAIIKGIDSELTEKRNAMSRLSPTNAKYSELQADALALTRRRNQLITGAEARRAIRANAPALISAPAPSSTSTERVLVRDKSGKQFTVPKSQLQQAIAEGYTPIE